jgi:hypothetical protein
MNLSDYKKCRCCAQLKPIAEFRSALKEDDRILKTCSECRAKTHPKQGDYYITPCRPPAEWIALNRLWPAPK